ncbi:hypothetical protein B0F90DRAFT_1689116 [Multifurca ochricompacta]|uniref:Uncharacterized protein n=1 Tax=Multifurca ochricompacta TaxID=376703 RepID=A0AAD4QQ64_9AGAM|nr:hypothetical protein B0F90DRAFT_1689116 [Multifurca ochricompacta]
MIYEKAQNGVGGVWRDNTYPGCGSDIPGHWYSLSRALNANWASYYADQREIRAYWDALWARHGLQAHTRCGTEVVRATWDAQEHVYTIELEDVVSRARRIVTARVVISATGGFQMPRVPEDLPGAETFDGESWHSAEWRHDVPLAGKRVGVIGNGCSVAQFVPQISKDPSVEVINFCRSPQWYLPRIQFDYPGWAKWVFAHIPFAMRAYRAFLMGRSDIGFQMFYPDSRFQRAARTVMTDYIKKMAPEKYHTKLIPHSGVQAHLLDPGYLESLHRPNVTLNYDAIERIVSRGVQLKTGEIVPLDVLIFGTGFSLLPPRLEVYGVGGLRLADYWKSKGGPEAYYGLAVPNFPNYFMLLGPNSAGGHASVIFIEEVQIQHTMQLIQPILTGSVRSYMVREKASAKYNSWVQTRLARTVWAFCDSYYRREGANGKIIAIFPGSVTLFWWLVRFPRYSDYEIVGKEGWEGTRRWWMKRLLFLLLGVFVVVNNKIK